MLFFPEFLPENRYPNKKEVNAATNRRMLLYCSPCLFHFPAPVNIIKNQYRIIMRFSHNLAEIFFRGFLPVIAINESKINIFKVAEYIFKCIVKISFNKFYVFDAKLLKVLMRNICNFVCSFRCNDF